MPSLDDEVAGRVSEADDDELCNVGTEEVGGAWLGVVTDNGRLALGVGYLLGAPGELCVAPPLRWVRRSAVQREARVALEVEGLQRAPHAPQPQFPLGEDYLGATDARGAVSPEGGEGLVHVGIKETAGQGGELWSLGFHVVPARHGLQTP